MAIFLEGALATVEETMTDNAGEMTRCSRDPVDRTMKTMTTIMIMTIGKRKGEYC